MDKLLTILSILWLFAATCSAQKLSDPINYESLDTAQIRSVLSERIGFSEQNTDSLAAKFQHLYSRSNTLHFWWGRMKASALLGYAYEMSGNSELSLMCFMRAMSIANETREFNPYLTYIYIMLADEYEAREDYDKISGILDKCEQYVTYFRSRYSEADFANELLDIYSLRSRAYTGLNQFSDAENALNIAVRKVSSVGRMKPYQRLKINMTRYYLDFKLKKYKDCERLIFENIKITRQVEGHDRDRFKYAHVLAGLYIKMQDYDRAYVYADSAKRASLYHTFIQWQLRLHKKMISADSATGNTARLVERYQTIQSLQDTLQRKNRLSNTAYYQTELDIQTHINSLKQKETELRNKSIVIALAVTLVLFLSVIIFLIWRSFSKTKQNVHELSRLNEQIKSKHTDMMIAYSSLEKSYEDNKQLIKVVAHDLRNPLASSMLFLENIQTQLIMNLDTVKALSTIKTNTSNSLSLIDDLLHSNHELEEAHIEVVELHSLLQYCVNLLTEKAAEKMQEIKLRTEPAKLLIDREKIWRVMSNLIHNAIKFSPVGSSIEVEVKHLKGKVLTIIKDHGIGIPESYKEDIFEMFSASQRPGTNGEESFGMGLAISKSIVESFKGKIWFDSEENSGTTFFVEFPLSYTQEN